MSNREMTPWTTPDETDTERYGRLAREANDRVLELAAEAVDALGTPFEQVALAASEAAWDDYVACRDLYRDQLAAEREARA